MGLRIKGEHRSSQHRSGPNKGHLWKFEIYDKNYTGSFIVLPRLDIKAISINPSTGTRNMFHYTKPTSCDIHLINVGDLDLFIEDLKTSEEKDMHVRIYRDSQEEVRGYVLRNQVTRQDTNPEFIKIVVNDSLADLNKYEYIANDGSAFSGDLTLVGHIMQVLNSMYIDELYEDTDDILALSIPYYEVDMQDKIDTPSWSQIRLNHQAFTEYEERSWIEIVTIESEIFSFPIPVPKSELVPVNFATCLDVVKRINRVFNAELLHQDGYYHIITKSEYAKTSFTKFIFKKNGSFRIEPSRISTPLDKVVNIKLSKGQETYLDPLKRVQIDHELGVSKNLISGLTWDHINNNKIDDIIFVSNEGDAKLILSFTINVATIARSVSFPVLHFYLMRIEVKVGNQWLKREYVRFDELGDPLYTEFSWSSTQAFVEVLSESSASGINVKAQVDIEYPISTPGMLCVGMSLYKILGINGIQEYPLSGVFNSFVFGTEVSHDFEWTWSSYNSVIRVTSENQEVNENSRTFIRSIAEINPKNKDIHKDSVMIGDDPGGTNFNKLQIKNSSGLWVDSKAWQIDNTGLVRPLVETMTFDMARLRAQLLTVMTCNMICWDDLMRPSQRLLHRGVTYIPVSYNYNSELEQTGRAEFIQVKANNHKATSSSSGRITVGIVSVVSQAEVNATGSGSSSGSGGGGGSQSNSYYQEWTGNEIINNTLDLSKEVLPDPSLFSRSEIHARVILSLNGSDMFHSDNVIHKRQFRIIAANQIQLRDVRPNDIFKLRMF